MKRLRRGEKGFTLVELLVVMAILAVLAAMVFPTVTGMKTGGETASSKGDAKGVENAINAFNTSDRVQSFPELPMSCSGSGATLSLVYTNTIISVPATKTVASGKITAAVATQLGLECSGGSVTNANYINWNAAAEVRQRDGGTKAMSFVPDFLASKPKSALWVRGSNVNSDPDEILWFLKEGTASDGLAGRTLQVLRLNPDGTVYEVVRY